MVPPKPACEQLQLTNNNVLRVAAVEDAAAVSGNAWTDNGTTFDYAQASNPVSN